MLFYDDLAQYLAQQAARLDGLRQSNIPGLGVISKVLSPGPDQHAHGTVAGYSATRAADAIEVDSQGVIGDRHRSVARPSTGRETSTYPKGTVIRQHRHLCVVCSHDCRVLSDRLDVEVTPELLGADLVIDRLDGADFSLSQLPHATHLLVMPDGASDAPKPPIATIVHFVQQQGCGITGNAIAARYGDKRLVKAFREQARDHRGIICSVEYPVESRATLRAGQRIAFRFPSAIAP